MSLIMIVCESKCACRFAFDRYSRRNCNVNFLEERIMKDGIVKEGNVLKVDSFLNHQMDIRLFDQIGEEFKKRFEGTEKIGRAHV